MKRAASLPPELLQHFQAYLEPTDLDNVVLVEPSDEAPLRPAKIDVWISFVPRLKMFLARRENLPDIRASSIPELHAKLTEALGGAEIVLHLSKVARAEVVARKRGVPRAEGWH
jgi:hypothetical protein